VDLANLKLVPKFPGESEDESIYYGSVLYLRALSIIRGAMMYAKRFWQLKDQTITASINQGDLLLHLP